MSEQEQHQHEQPDPNTPRRWDPDEEVGDIYQVEVGDDGQIESAEKLDPDAPRIWVGSLLDYGNGVLYGDWMGAAREPSDIQQNIDALLAASPTAAETGDVAEEWGIFDYDNFGPLRIDEYESIDYVAKVARGITEHGLAFGAYADVMQDEDAFAGFEEDYIGHYSGLEEYAEQMVEELGYEHALDSLPEGIRPYVRIDTDQLARDMDYSGEVHVLDADDGGVWIFYAR